MLEKCFSSTYHILAYSHVPRYCTRGIQNMMSKKAAFLSVRVDFVFLLISLLRNEIIPHNYMRWVMGKVSILCYSLKDGSQIRRRKKWVMKKCWMPTVARSASCPQKRFCFVLFFFFLEWPLELLRRLHFVGLLASTNNNILILNRGI